MSKETQSQFDDICCRLSEFYAPNEIMQWLYAPHPLLEGRVPIWLLIEGRGDEVDQAIKILESDGYI